MYTTDADERAMALYYGEVTKLGSKLYGISMSYCIWHMAYRGANLAPVHCRKIQMTLKRWIGKPQLLPNIFEIELNT